MTFSALTRMRAAAMWVVALLTACSRSSNTAVTIILPPHLEGRPSIVFPDVPASTLARTIKWSATSDTTIAAAVYLSEQQFAILTFPGSQVATLTLLTPRQPISFRLHADSISVKNNPVASDFHHYLTSMQRFSDRCADADSIQRIAYTDSMRSATLNYIHTHPLSKGVLVALQAVDPNGHPLLPLERNLSLYRGIDSLLHSVYHDSKLMQQLSAAINAHTHVSGNETLVDSAHGDMTIKWEKPTLPTE